MKRVIMRGCPRRPRALAMLKRQEADIAFALDGAIAEEVKRTRTSPWWKRGLLRLLDRVSRAVRAGLGLGGPARAPRGELCPGSAGDQ